MTELFTIVTKKNPQTWKKTPTKNPTHKHPRMNNISWYFPIKNFQEVLAQGTKLWKLILLVKEVQQVNHSTLTVTLIQTSVKSTEEINTSSASSAT